MIAGWIFNRSAGAYAFSGVTFPFIGFVSQTFLGINPSQGQPTGMPWQLPQILSQSHLY
jgi:hypothetical protein